MTSLPKKTTFTHPRWTLLIWGGGGGGDPIQPSTLSTETWLSFLLPTMWEIVESLRMEHVSAV